ncbi:MAG: IMP cyclohydrolase [Chloroflexota bacterium]
MNPLAQRNFERHLEQNSYPGRGLVIGRSSVGSWLILYWIMGRSPNSRNRKFVADGMTLRTEPIDPAKVVDPSLIIYEAMLDLPGVYLVGNGDHTRTLYEAIARGNTVNRALLTREREPDAPNYTPRISGLLRPVHAKAPILLSILKANMLDPALTDRSNYRPAIPTTGVGYGLTTYKEDGNPLPSFVGDPLLLPLEGTAVHVLETYWNGLDADNRVALAVKEVDDNGRSRIVIQNKHQA